MYLKLNDNTKRKAMAWFCTNALLWTIVDSSIITMFQKEFYLFGVFKLLSVQVPTCYMDSFAIPSPLFTLFFILYLVLSKRWEALTSYSQEDSLTIARRVGLWLKVYNILQLLFLPLPFAVIRCCLSTWKCTVL